MKGGRRISVIIPAYNEAERIGATLDSLNQSWVDEIIVVNDGSTDNTPEIVGEYPVTLINFEKNYGKGKAVKEGIKASSGDLLLLLDADLGESVGEMEKLLDPVIREEAEVAIAVLPVKGGGLGLVRKLADYGLKFLTGQSMRAPLSGQRVISRSLIDKMETLPQGFGLEIGMDIELIRAGINFKEIECNLKHRVTGRDIKGFIHRSKQFMAILSTIWQMRR